jgi:hypothetical protein
MVETAQHMNRELKAAKQFLNGDLMNKNDLFSRIITPRHYYINTAKKICFDYHSVVKGTESTRMLNLTPYKGMNTHVKALQDFLRRNNNSDIICTLLHGSVASDEVLPYSDFDAIVVIKDEVMRDPEKMAVMSRLLYKARRFFHLFDPFQHHGWMIFTESELKTSGALAVPMSLLRSSLVITGSDQLEVRTDSQPQKGNLNSICDQIKDMIIKNRFPVNRYSLKSILSEFMLTPALYLQGRYAIDISKKDSFERARIDFTAEEYSIMDEVSTIRAHWSRDISRWRWTLMTNLRMLPGAKVAKISGRIPMNIRQMINKDFLHRMTVLLDSMKDKTAQTNK